MVTAHDSESGRPGLNPEWGLIYNLFYLFILFFHQHMQLQFQIYTNVVNKRGRQCW